MLHHRATRACIAQTRGVSNTNSCHSAGAPTGDLGEKTSLFTMWFRATHSLFMRALGSFSTTRAPRLAGSAVSRRLMHSPRSYFDASTPRPRLAQQDRPGARSLRQRACALMAAEPAAGHAPSCGGMPHHTARTPDQPFVTVENFVLARLPLCQEKVPAEVPTVDSRGGGPGRCRSSRRS